MTSLANGLAPTGLWDVALPTVEGGTLRLRDLVRRAELAAAC